MTDRSQLSVHLNSAMQSQFEGTSIKHLLVLINPVYATSEIIKLSQKLRPKDMLLYAQSMRREHHG